MLPESKRCPNCGKSMADGYMLGGYNHHLQWFPKGTAQSAWEKVKLKLSFKRPGSVESMMLLSPASFTCVKLPAQNCPDCKLVILDYNENDMME